MKDGPTCLRLRTPNPPPCSGGVVDRVRMTSAAIPYSGRSWVKGIVRRRKACCFNTETLRKSLASLAQRSRKLTHLIAASSDFGSIIHYDAKGLSVTSNHIAEGQEFVAGAGFILRQVQQKHHLRKSAKVYGGFRKLWPRLEPTNCRLPSFAGGLLPGSVCQTPSRTPQRELH